MAHTGPLLLKNGQSNNNHDKGGRYGHSSNQASNDDSGGNIFHVINMDTEPIVIVSQRWINSNDHRPFELEMKAETTYFIF